MSHSDTKKKAAQNQKWWMNWAKIKKNFKSDLGINESRKCHLDYQKKKSIKCVCVCASSSIRHNSCYFWMNESQSIGMNSGNSMDRFIENWLLVSTMDVSLFLYDWHPANMLAVCILQVENVFLLCSLIPSPV